MGKLQQDIDAIIKAMEDGQEGLDIGYLETSNDNWCSIPPRPHRSAHTLSTLANLQSSFSEDARIALVFLDSGVYKHRTCAWYEAAARFCDEEIAGVLVIGRTPNWTSSHLESSSSADAEWLESLPEALWASGMPVFFDEIGCLLDVATLSHELAHDPALSFVKGDSIQKAHVVSMGNWRHGTYPVFDATYTPEACRLAYNRAVIEIEETILSLFEFLESTIVDFDANAYSEKELFKLAEKLFPGCVDDVIFDFIHEPEVSLPTYPYALAFDCSRIPEYTGLSAKFKLLQDVCKAAENAFRDSNLAFVIPEGEDIDEVAAFKDSFDVVGATAAIEAVKAGVPVEDVVA